MTQLNKLNKADRTKIRQEHRGLIVRVARNLGVSHAVVSRVFDRKMTSRRVRAALEAELRRLEKEQQGEVAA